MPRNYQPKKNNPYRLPPNVYMQCLYAIRDYDRLCAERTDILHSSPSLDGQPRGGETSDTTADKAVRLERLSRMCEDVEQALVQVPTEYRRGVVSGIMYGCYPNNADPETYRRWRRKLLFWLAEKKGML